MFLYNKSIFLSFLLWFEPITDQKQKEEEQEIRLTTFETLSSSICSIFTRFELWIFHENCLVSSTHTNNQQYNRFIFIVYFKVHLNIHNNRKTTNKNDWTKYSHILQTKSALKLIIIGEDGEKGIDKNAVVVSE